MDPNPNNVIEMDPIINKVTKLIDGRTLDALKEFVDTYDRKDLIKIFNNVRKYIIERKYDIKKTVSAKPIRAKYYRLIFDMEIICDCIIDVIGPLSLTDKMEEWKPYPFNDEGEIYMLYRRYRYKKKTSIAQIVPDELIINLIECNTEAKPPAKPAIKDSEEYYLDRGCTETQLAYIKLFTLTKKYIEEKLITDGKELSINKSVKIVYNENKDIFPKWEDSSLNSLYHKGQNLTINI